jgi:hypothetical protein
MTDLFPRPWQLILFAALGALCVWAKVAGVIFWPWWSVLMPFWFPALVMALLWIVLRPLIRDAAARASEKEDGSSRFDEEDPN